MSKTINEKKKQLNPQGNKRKNVKLSELSFSTLSAKRVSYLSSQEIKQKVKTPPVFNDFPDIYKKKLKITEKGYPTIKLSNFARDWKLLGSVTHNKCYQRKIVKIKVQQLKKMFINSLFLQNLHMKSDITYFKKY